jgi:predicted phage-related endonuclease
VSLTDAQLAERRAYLGGSDAPAIAGMNPPRWSQPIDVFLEKRPDLAGEQPPKPTHALMGLGTLLEPVVAELFTAQTGIRLRRQLAPVRSRRWPWMGGHLDRRAYQAIFEAKWAQGDRGWGESMWDQQQGGWRDLEPVVPPHYALQVQHYLAVTQVPVAFVGLLLGYAEFRCYRIRRDPVLEDALVELERRFWHENVLAGVPPEPDGSEGYGRAIAARLAQDAGTELVATPEVAMRMNVLRNAVRDRKEAERNERLLRQQIQLSMDDAARLVGPTFTATYRTHQVRTVAWEKVARDLATDLILARGEAILSEQGATTALLEGEHPRIDEVVAEAATARTTISTQRPFKPKWDDEEENDGSY